MELIITFIIALGLAMDCFTISISNSSVSGEVKPGIPLKVAVAFTFAHLLMLYLGSLLGGAIQHHFEGVESWVAFIILGIIGVKMILEARKRHPKQKVFDINNVGVIIVLSLATAMDAFLTGVAVAMTDIRLSLASVLIAITVFIFSLGGMAGGKQLGVAFAQRTAYFGGAFMLLAAATFLFLIL